METGFKAWLDGVALDSLCDDLYTIDISEASPVMDVSTHDRNGYGQSVSSLARRALTVTIAFEVHTYDPQDRQSAVDKVMLWATGHRLETNTRPGKHLNVVCTRYPQISALRWTNQLTVELTAYEVPYWQDSVSRRAQRSGNGTVDLHVPGSVETEMESRAVNSSSGTCNSVQISCGGMVMAFENLDLASGETLLIVHGEGNRLQLMIENQQKVRRSVYEKRTVESVDEVMLKPGKNTISCTADRALDYTMEARGRWL